jgi:hypothetical protein
MKRLSFIDALLCAVALSVLGSVLAVLLAPLCSGVLLSRGLCTVLALAYVLFLLMRSRLRSGRVSLLAVWSLAALAIVLFSPSLLSMVAAHLALIWLVRTLLFLSSPLLALADLVLSALSLAAGCWALMETGSVLLSLWSLLLVQATCTLLPARLGKPATARATDADHEQGFAHAARAAEQALQILSSSR